MTSRQQIRQALLELLEKVPDGIKYSTLIQRIAARESNNGESNPT